MPRSHVAALVAIVLTSTACAPPPAYPKPIDTSEDLLTGGVLLAGVGIVGGTVACATECSSPYNTAVPVVVGVAAVAGVFGLLYVIGQGRGLR